MSIRFIALAMVLNSSVSIVAWESARPVPARAQTEDCVERLSEPQDQASKCLSEATRLPKERDSGRCNLYEPSAGDGCAGLVQFGSLKAIA